MQDIIAQAQRRLDARKDLAATRAANEAPQRPSAAELTKLESSIKRNNAVARKLRGLTDATLEGALADVRSTNQGKFLSETVAALLEAAPKPSRVPCVLEVRHCSTRLARRSRLARRNAWGNLRRCGCTAGSPWTHTSHNTPMRVVAALHTMACARGLYGLLHTICNLG